VGGKMAKNKSECAECGKKYTPEKGNPAQKYCSISCWKKANEVKG